MKPKSKPCPKCGGTDRYYYISSARFANNKAVWRCNQCGIWHLAGEVSENEELPSAQVFTNEQREAIIDAYDATTNFCQELLWGNKGIKALRWRRMGLVSSHYY